MPGYNVVGNNLRHLLGELVDKNWDSLNKIILDSLGTDDCSDFPKDVLEQARQQIAYTFGAPTLNTKGFQGNLFGAVLGTANDPETEVPKWLTTFAPIGVRRPIRPSGIFPEIPTRHVGPDMGELTENTAKWMQEASWSGAAGSDGNYASFNENQKAAEAELAKDFDKNYFQWYPTQAAAELVHGKLTVSRMAAICSEKNGKIKTG